MSIKIENVVLPSPQQWMAVIRGARNPLNSWDRMDSYISEDGEFFMGEADHKLLMKLTKAGKDHRKFMRMIPVFMDIVAPLYWWKEFDTYKVGTVANSCSTMHTVHKKEFELGDFSCDRMRGWVLESLDDIVSELNALREQYNEAKLKEDWDSIIQLLPSSYNQRRTVTLNYEVLSNMYHARKNHKLQEWRDLCAWIESLPYSELITCGCKPKVLYICDGEACGAECPNHDCMYTSDITHARHFHSEGEFYMEDYEE